MRTVRITRYLIVPLTFVAIIMPEAQTFAQGVFPAPPPGQGGVLTSNALLFPQVNNAPLIAGGPVDACKGFFLLREEAEKRGQLIKAAAARHASPDEACKLFRNLVQSEIKMTDYIEINSINCKISPHIAELLRADRKNTETVQIKVCRMAQEAQSHSPSLNELLGPQKKEPAGPVGDFDRVR
jgi:hypothetical protein